MVTLKNVTRTNNIFEYDYYPEWHKDELGHIKYDLDKEEIIDVQYSKEDDVYFHGYAIKSTRALKKMLKENNNEILDEYVMMWY